MNKENMIRWAEALESENYLQAKGQLCNGQGYCCLGIAELVAGREFEHCHDDIYRVKGTENYNDLSVSTANWLELATVNEIGFWYNPTLVVPLELQDESIGPLEDAITLNDEIGMSFSDIAKCVRATAEMYCE